MKIGMSPQQSLSIPFGFYTRCVAGSVYEVASCLPVNGGHAVSSAQYSACVLHKALCTLNQQIASNFGHAVPTFLVHACVLRTWKRCVLKGYTPGRLDIQHRQWTGSMTLLARAVEKQRHHHGAVWQRS